MDEKLPSIADVLPASGLWESAPSVGEGDGPASIGDPYRFTAFRADGTPVTWDACTPIRVVINPAGAPESGVEDAKAALAMISEASGLRFEFVGLSDEQVGPHRNPRRGGVWAPVLFGWTSPEQGVLGGTTSGRAYVTRATTDGREALVSAVVAINTGLEAGKPAGFDDPGARGNIYLHELAHVAGLAHVDNPGQLMYPNSGLVQGFQAGDLEGLRVAGSQPCAGAHS